MLPTFIELAENKLKHAGKRDKTINIKVAINTARMMVEAEKGESARVTAALAESYNYLAMRGAKMDMAEAAQESLASQILKALEGQHVAHS